MTTPGEAIPHPPTSGITYLYGTRLTTARYRWSHSGNDFHAFPRVTSTAAPPLGSHRRTKAKSRYNDPTSTSASPAAMAGGSLPTHAAGMLDSATRSPIAVRDRRMSGAGSMGVYLAIPALSPSD